MKMYTGIKVIPFLVKRAIEIIYIYIFIDSTTHEEQLPSRLGCAKGIECRYGMALALVYVHVEHKNILRYDYEACIYCSSRSFAASIVNIRQKSSPFN